MHDREERQMKRFVRIFLALSLVLAAGCASSCNIVVHVVDADVARISEEDFPGCGLNAIIRRMSKRRHIERVSFVIDKDIGCCDFTDNFLSPCGEAGVWSCAFQTENGDVCFDYGWLYLFYFMQSRMEKPRIAAVCIGSNGCLAYDANFQRAGCGGEEYELEQPLFTDGEDDVFGDGKAGEYAAAIVAIASNDAPVSFAIACVRRLYVAGYKKVFIIRN